jgi:hypothetical protein
VVRFLVGLLVVLVTSVPATARSHGHVVFGFGAFFGPPAYYYYGPPVYYYPPPVYYYPPPVYYAPAPAPVVQPYCRQYRGDAIVDASGQPFYGTACLEADGRWHIVN